MNSKQLSIALGVVVVVLLAVVGYMALKDNSQNDTLSQQNTTPNSNLMQDNANTQPVNQTTPTPPASNQQSATSKTYTNTKYGFEVQYPSNWIVKEEGDYIAFRSSDSQKGVEENTKNCNDNNPQTSCNPEYYVDENVSFSAEIGDRATTPLKGTKTFNGIKFNKYVEGGLFGDYTTYVTIKNGINYAFYTDEQNVSYMEQILTTFKFTK